METKVVKKGGVNHISVDGKIIDTVAFKSFRPTLNNVNDFYKSGVRIFHAFVSGLKSGIKMPYSAYGEVWFGEGDYRFENFDRQMEMFIEAAPDAYIFINLHLDVREWWLKENPGNVDSFTHLSQIAGNEKWRRDTEDYIRAFIKYAEEKYGDRIIGYWLLGGFTTEWFSAKDHEESHPVKLEAFRKYMGDPSVEIPSKEEREKPSSQIFLDPIKDALLIKYRRFHAELISGLVLDFCRTAKEALGYKKIVGVFFGYIMELAFKNGSLWNYGHLDLDRVNESPYVDLIATPSSYKYRQYDDGTAYMILCDSLALHQKAYFASFDNLTFLTPTALENPRRLCNDPETKDAMIALQTNFVRKDLLNTREKTIHAMRREMMHRFASRCGTWWFDMLEGWYYDDGLMDEISSLTAHSAEILKKERNSASEICVFVSTDPLYYVNKLSFINEECICQQRLALSRIGAPFDLVSMSDLKNVDADQYKLFIFLDAYSLTEKERDYINGTLKKNGRSVLLIGACDYINKDGVSLERTSRLVEMELGLLEKDEATVRAMNSVYGYEEPKNPTIYIKDGGAIPLGRFADSRKCALAKKEEKDYKIFYSALGHISDKVLRDIARESGVHIYAEDGVFTYIDNCVAGVYNTSAETTTLILKEDGEYKELFSGKTYKTENCKVTLPTGDSPSQMLVLKK
ncbi:MAG: hypothetical protein IKM18_00320 [Clostridia bacterium]|nr:hypothetical protein [Clostridia bacterium]MBR3714334.1 hypothetical protein [Clostridia bacterium]